MTAAVTGGDARDVSPGTLPVPGYASLARRMTGVHESTVSRRCTNPGFGMLTMRRAEEISRVLGCSVKDLFEEEGPAA